MQLLTFLQVQRSKTGETSQRLRVMRAERPSRARVDAGLLNMPEFAEAFSQPC